MALKSHVLDTKEREARQKEYLAAPLLSDAFPNVAQLSVQMRFTDPEGKQKPQPYAQVFVPDMRAYFRFQCPLKDCGGGGFDLTTAVPRGMRKDASGRGTMTCNGQRKRQHGPTAACGLHLEYALAAASKPRARAA